MPEGQAKPCDSCKWVDVLRASLKQQVKSCCICLKTGQATGSHQLSGTEFKINLPTTGIISILFSTQESSGPSPPSPLFFLSCQYFFLPEFKDPSWNCYFYHAAVPVLWEITPRTAKDTSSLFSFGLFLGHVCLLSCQWHSYFCDCHAQSRCYQSKLFLHVL